MDREDDPERDEGEAEWDGRVARPARHGEHGRATARAVEALVSRLVEARRDGTSTDDIEGSGDDDAKRDT